MTAEEIRDALENLLFRRSEAERLERERKEAKARYSYEPRKFESLEELAEFAEEGGRKLAALRAAETALAEGQAEREAAERAVMRFLLRDCAVNYTADDGKTYHISHQSRRGSYDFGPYKIYVRPTQKRAKSHTA